jgi:hypothetical protein
MKHPQALGALARSETPVPRIANEWKRDYAEHLATPRRSVRVHAMLFAKLISWWRRRPLEHLRMVLYTRQGCHLCESAWQELQQRQRYYGFGLEAVDIDTDPTLAQQYGEVVPVVAVNGKVRFRGGVNSVLLDRLLRAESLRASRAHRPGPRQAPESP